MSKERIGSIKDHTPNFKIIIPRFDLATWHDYIEENFRNIDALFFNLFGINNYSGSWKQITEYKQGQVLFIPDDRDINGKETDYSGRLVKVLQDHTTDNSDYFNVFYSLHPEYYELFADASTAQIYAQQAQSYKNETETLKNETNSIKNDTNLIKSEVITKQNEINNTISSFNDEFSEKTEEIIQKIEDGKAIFAQKLAISAENIEKSRIWAEGEQEEVETLGGTLSSRGHADLAMAIANADEDVPIDASDLIALDVIKGPKGDKGDKGEDGKDGVDGYTTNCIIKIPQDIKLELNNGTLTLKAGSRVYVPNGAGKFDEVEITKDLSTAFDNNNQKMVFVTPEKNAIHHCNVVNQQSSGASSTSTSSYNFWYDTTNNYVKFTNNSGSTWTSGYSLPICLVTKDSGIDQVFNGFGYIGSTVFALPNVKGLIPNGRNADGSLKNIEFTLSGVKLLDCSNRTNMTDALFLYNDLTLFRTEYKDYIVSESQPTINPSFRIFWYNTEINIIKEYLNGSPTARTAIFLGTYNVDSSGKIAFLSTKLPFHAVGRNDSSWIAQQAMPSGKYIDLTLGASGTNYTAPANGYFYIDKSTGVTGAYLYLSNNTGKIGSEYAITNATSNHCRVYIPAKKGDVVNISYNVTGTTHSFRFVYAEGEN